MTRIASILAGVLLASSCAAQNPRDQSHGFAEAAKQSKITLVEAIQKASAALSGTVVQAALQPATKAQPNVAYQVFVLREGKVFAIPVDAVSGVAGKPKELAADDDDDDEQNETEAKMSAKPDEKPAASSGQVAAGTKLDFEAVDPGKLPTGWVVAETAGAGQPGKWSVQEAAGAPSGKRVLRLVETKNSGVTFNLMLSEAVFPADLDLGVRIHADTGNEDRGGGLIWRAKDADNYYVTRWNPLEDNLRAYKVVGGRRSMFKSVEVKTDATQWHAMRVRAKGKSFEVLFDGKIMITFEDDTFAQAGKVGLWTKADAASSFDDLEVAGKQ